MILLFPKLWYYCWSLYILNFFFNSNTTTISNNSMKRKSGEHKNKMTIKKRKQAQKGQLFFFCWWCFVFLCLFMESIVEMGWKFLLSLSHSRDFLFFILLFYSRKVKIHVEKLILLLKSIWSGNILKQIWCYFCSLFFVAVFLKYFL